MTQKPKFELDLRSLLEGFDSLVNFILNDESKNQRIVTNAAKSLMIEIEKFRNEYNYVKEKNADLDSSFSADENEAAEDVLSNSQKKGFSATISSYTPSSSSGDSLSSSATSRINTTANTQIIIGDEDLNKDAQSATLRAKKWEYLIRIKPKATTAMGNIVDKFKRTKHIWSLNATRNGRNMIYLFYIFENMFDKKPLHAFFAKDIEISMQGEKLLILKVSNVELKYEAETNIHARNWIELFKDAKLQAIADLDGAITYPMPNQEVELPAQVKEAATISNQPLAPTKPIPKPPVADEEKQQIKQPVIVKSGDMGLAKQIIDEIKNKQNTRKNSCQFAENISQSSFETDESPKSPPPPVPTSSIPPKPTAATDDKSDDIYVDVDSATSSSSTRASQQQIEEESNDESYEQQNYVNSDFYAMSTNYDSLYLCQYDTTTGGGYMLDLKRGDIVQLIEKASNAYFIAKQLPCSGGDAKASTTVGLCNFNNFIKLYKRI